jgi:hypothetical protein
VLRIWQHGFTEMFNNASDHSEDTKIRVEIRRTAVTTEMIVADDGVGPRTLAFAPEENTTPLNNEWSQRSDLAPYLRAQEFVHRVRIVIRENAYQQLMGRGPFTAEVPKRAAGEVVAPDVSEQERPGKCATNSPGIVPEVEFPQRFRGHLRCIRPVPAAPNCNRICAAHPHPPSPELACRRSSRAACAESSE